MKIVVENRTGLRQGGFQGMMAVGADRERQSHRGPFKNHCRFVPAVKPRVGGRTWLVRWGKGRRGMCRQRWWHQ